MVLAIREKLLREAWLAIVAPLGILGKRIGGWTESGPPPDRLAVLVVPLGESVAASTNSSSQVSVRLVVNGPVSSIFSLPTLPQRGFSVGSPLSVAQEW